MRYTDGGKKGTRGRACAILYSRGEWSGEEVNGRERRRRGKNRWVMENGGKRRHEREEEVEEACHTPQPRKHPLIGEMEGTVRWRRGQERGTGGGGGREGSKRGPEEAAPCATSSHGDSSLSEHQGSLSIFLRYATIAFPTGVRRGGNPISSVYVDAPRERALAVFRGELPPRTQEHGERERESRRKWVFGRG